MSLTHILQLFKEEDISNSHINIIEIISSQLDLPPAIVKKGILKQDLLKINDKVVHSIEIYLAKNSIIKFGKKIINIPPPQQKPQQIDLLIKYLLKSYAVGKISEVTSYDRNKFCCYIIEYCSINEEGNFELTKSVHHSEIFEQLEAFYKENLKDVKDNKIPKRKDLLEALIRSRKEAYRALKNLTQNLIDDIFSENLYRFLQEYSKLIASNNFQFCIAPTQSSSVYARPSLETLIKPAYDAQKLKEIDEKYAHFEHGQKVFDNYFSLLDLSDPVHLNIYHPISRKLIELLKALCEVAEIKSANIFIEPISRKYNFENSNREIYELLLIIRNKGEGLAREIVISNQDINFSFEDVQAGILRPGESRNITIYSKITASDFSPILEIQCSWIDMANETVTCSEVIQFELQDNKVPWDDLIKSKPYTIQEIEDKDKLYGRDEILEELSVNILSSKIESYKIWGQKRVGKSSVVKTLKSLFVNEDKIIVVWRSIAGLKNTNPISTLNTLGESLCGEIYEELDRKIKDGLLKEKLKDIEVPEFNGSLYPLETYIRKLKGYDNSLKFVFILDEFDRINEDFFLPGEIGDTLSLNIGKGLNEKAYIGFILVGSENMHLLDRQGINYNGYQEREIDTFDKIREYESFKNIVIGPVEPYLRYSDGAIELIYDNTNGNPYFANLICSHIFKTASTNRDSEIDINITDSAIDIIVNSSQKSHFEHFWGDGITEETNIKKEKKTDIRRRLLVSFSFAYHRNKTFPTKPELIRNFKKPTEYPIESFEIENTVTEFFNRKIFWEDGSGKIRIKPVLFERWLCGPGRTLMIEGISDLEALQKEKELEEEFSLKNEEVKRICENYYFQGNKLKTSEVVKFFEQFGDSIPQRRVFKLIDSLYYLPKKDLNEFFRSEQRNIFKEQNIELKIGAKTLYRDGVEVFCFSDTLLENTEITDSFKVLCHIRSTKTVKDVKNFREVIRSNEVNDVILFSSVLTNYQSINDALKSILSEKSNPHSLPIKLVCLVITSKAKADLIKATSSIPNFKLIFYKEVQETKVKPFIESTEVFETKEEANLALWEIRKLFPEVNNDLLNIVFETHCPDQSLPILWCKTNHFQPLFHNPFGDKGKYEQKDGEKNRDIVYFFNKEIERKLNSYIMNYIRAKALEDNNESWFNVKYIPKSVVMEVNTRHIEENQTAPIESYFDFRHYGQIIKFHPELSKTFSLPADGLKWCDELNRLRRDPAHPIKPAPNDSEVAYIERIKNLLLKIL